MMTAAETPVIVVLAGVNGAGKSSIAGALLRETGLAYLNPDEVARSIREATGCSVEEANSLAWLDGKERLEKAIEGHLSFAFETTLGGKSISALLLKAAMAGIDVLIWFIGLSSAELHIARVRARVAVGGHDIADAKILERWESSRRNLIALMPHVTELRVFDNSQEADEVSVGIPEPVLILHCRKGAVVGPTGCSVETTPGWAQPIVAAALQIHQ